jgi:hypothetical protein
MARKQDSTRKLESQLTGLAGFDDLLDKSHTETDRHDARADNLARRRSNKRLKTKSIQKAAERDRGRTPKRLSGRLRDRSALDFSFSLVAVRACACLGERSEPTCIRQAHATVPKAQNRAQMGIKLRGVFRLPVVAMYANHPWIT